MADRRLRTFSPGREGLPHLFARSYARPQWTARAKQFGGRYAVDLLQMCHIRGNRPVRQLGSRSGRTDAVSTSLQRQAQPSPLALTDPQAQGLKRWEVRGGTQKLFLRCDTFTFSVRLIKAAISRLDQCNSPVSTGGLIRAAKIRCTYPRGNLLTRCCMRPVDQPSDPFGLIALQPQIHHRTRYPSQRCSLLFQSAFSTPQHDPSPRRPGVDTFACL